MQTLLLLTLVMASVAAPAGAAASRHASSHRIDGRMGPPPDQDLGAGATARQ